MLCHWLTVALRQPLSFFLNSPVPRVVLHAGCVGARLLRQKQADRFVDVVFELEGVWLVHRADWAAGCCERAKSQCVGGKAENAKSG